MHPNEQIIQNFYSAFDKKDYKTMQRFYADEAVFKDPAFRNLDAAEVKSMWEMLVTSASDLKVSVSDISADDNSGTCLWQAWYTFSATGRKVHNIIHASFQFKNGKIVKHNDSFDFWRWSRMALGLPGILLGWTPFLERKVRTTARKRLEKFMKGRAV